MNNQSTLIEKRLKFDLPKYTLIEEITNAITHGIGAVLGVVALVLLLVKTNPKSFSNMFCFSVYGASLVILYTVSTLYHALKINLAKKVFRKLDHCSIFLLIAGTYTPMTVLLIKGVAGTIILSTVWITAILGIILNAINVKKFAKFSICCYIIMGWAVIFAFKPLVQSLSSYQLTWLFVGGAAYTLGAILYVIGKKIKYMHSIWHLFVLFGSISHFMIFV